MNGLPILDNIIQDDFNLIEYVNNGENLPEIQDLDQIFGNISEDQVQQNQQPIGEQSREIGNNFFGFTILELIPNDRSYIDGFDLTFLDGQNCYQHAEEIQQYPVTKSEIVSKNKFEILYLKTNSKLIF